MDNSYNAHHLLVLEGLEAVRKRPGMYVGSTDTRGLMHCLWEIIDNAVDEALAGHGSCIEVTLHPDGSSVVNALSARLDVEVDRSPATQHMSFRRGAPGVFAGDGPDAPFTGQSGLHRGKRVGKGVTGTRVRFWPDRQVFTKDATFLLDDLATRARQTSFIVPGLELVIRDLRGPEPVVEIFRHDGGIAEFCDFLATDEPL